jgi:acetone carboxylase gamma subunit
VSRNTFDEEELVSFLVDECGLKLKSSYADYPPTAKMMAMSTDEVRQIKEYCDSLKEKAEFGDKVMKSVEMLKGLFK